MDVKLNKAKNGKKQKRAAARAAVERVGASRVDRELYERFGAYMEVLYDPEDATGALAPSEYTHAAAARRKPFDLSYTSSGTNQFVVYKMYPRITKTIIENRGGTVPAASADNVIFFELEDTIGAQTVAGLAGRPVVAYGGNATPDFELPMVSATLGGQSSLAVAATAPAAANVPLMAINRGDFGCRINMYYQDAVTLVWTAMATLPVPAGATVNFTTGAIANGISGFGFNVHNASDSPRSLKVNILVNERTPSLLPVVLAYPASASKGVSTLDDPQAIDQFRVTAMSMKLTCMGDLTTTAGRVACALVPREFVPDPADPVSSIAQLPIGAYDGKLVDGCHIIWQPRTAADYSFQAPESDAGSYYIVVAALLAHDATPIRLKASFNYEIFSLDPSIGAMSYCPSAFGLQEVTQAVFASVPPGSSNDGHLKKVKAVGRVLQRLVNYPIQWVRDNPDKAIALAKMAAAAALA